MADGINQMDEIDLKNLDFSESGDESSSSSESGDESSSSSESDNDPIPLRIHISNLWTATDNEGAGKNGYSLDDIFVVSDAYRTRLTNMSERFGVMMNNYLRDINRLLAAEANDDEDAADAAARVLEAAGDPPIEAMVSQNIRAIVNRWNHETDFFEVTTPEEYVGPTYKAFSNFHDIIEELLDELKAKESELEATKSIINAKNTDLEKLTFLLEAKTPNKIVNKLPEEIDKEIVKHIGGRKTRRAKKFLKLKTNKTNF
ncbi:MAG: hypothetical protein Ct9H90mP28_5400 [Paracoccaceae bacterium]|nr:MAG: hypothetical protein Ct9H90mP28_5400 [Paracoccaceae bacterium]